jgi:MEDS: MEthanogen/methylotroph, DcmR Sensory domain
MRFYADANRLFADVSRFLLDGLKNDEAVIVIATAAHRLTFEGLLRAGGIDLAAATASRQLMLLDAEESLVRFMTGTLEDGIPSAEAFRELVLSLLAQVAAHRRVRAYGEMASLLFERGNTLGSARLQTLWNELANDRRFDIYIAFRLGENGPRR